MYFVKIFTCTVVALILLSEHSTGQQAFCGPALYEILDNICKNGYQKMMLPTRKRSPLPQLGLDDDLPSNALVPYPYAGRSIFMDKMYGDLAEVMAKTRRRRMGIYYECCSKGCTLKEITAYCTDNN